jgi:uncharacterized repeat protein (TIGR01451 family)
MIVVHSVGGAGCTGAQTTGNGILLVKAGVATPSTVFALQGGWVTVGNFSYMLVRAADGNWYLRSPQDIGITKTSSNTQAIVGQTINYTVTVSNPGPGAADGTTVSDPVASGLTHVSWTCAPSGGATCTASGSGDLQDTLTAFPSASQAVYTITAKVAGTATGNIDNTATATPPGPGRTGSSASVVLPVGGGPGSGLAKPIPALSPARILLLLLLLAGIGAAALRRRRER